MRQSTPLARVKINPYPEIQNIAQLACIGVSRGGESRQYRAFRASTMYYVTISRIREIVFVEVDYPDSFAALFFNVYAAKGVVRMASREGLGGYLQKIVRSRSYDALTCA